MKFYFERGALISNLPLVYANALLANLNARVPHSGRGNTDDDGTLTINLSVARSKPLSMIVFNPSETMVCPDTVRKPFIN